MVYPPGGDLQENKPRTFVIPAVGAIIPLHDKHFTSLGLLGYAPYAEQLDWDADAAYRYNITRDKIGVTSMGGATAYKANDQFALGAGVFESEGNLTLENAVSSTTYAAIAGLPDAAFHATGHDSCPNYDLGALWRVGKRVRLGAAYHSPIDMTIGGNAALSIPGSRSSTIPGACR